MWNKSKSFFAAHKYTIIFVILVIFGAGYYLYSKYYTTTSQTKYTLAVSKKGVLINTVSGSGQVIPVNQIELKPRSSGDIIYLNNKAGTKVSEGDIIAKLDNKDAVSSVRSANTSLENAMLSHDKLKTENSNDKLTKTLTKSYDQTYSYINSALVDLPTVLNNLDNLRSNQSLDQNSARIYLGSSASGIKDKAESKYYKANDSIQALLRSYKDVNIKSSREIIVKAANDTYSATKDLNDAIKAEKDFVDALYENSNRLAVYQQIQSQLGTYYSTVNSHMSNLLSGISNINDNTNAFSSADISIKSSALSVKDKRNSLADAQTKLSDYIVRAPFSGLIAKSDAEVGDYASPSTVVATLITQKKVAQISLNEVDVSKVKTGQKATLTFDALSELTLTGTVSEIDLIGTVSSGVVTYNVKISIDEDDDRIKPEMSVTASIIVGTKDDVLLVPNSAVKKSNGTSYVEVSRESTSTLATTTKKVETEVIVGKVEVEVGDSNDEYTEIKSGLSEGDKVVTRTTTSGTTKTTSSNSSSQKSQSAIRLPGLGGR